MKSMTNTEQAASHLAKKPTLLNDYFELTKIRLSLLTVITTGVGFIMASPNGIFWTTLLWTVIGTTACACSAATLNQLFEHSKDAKMNRTSNRPIPTGRISKIHAFIFGSIIGYLGIAILALLANITAAAIALLTILIYLFAYTPLKTRTSLNTFIGAFVGALPPLIGWVAASDSFGRGGIMLAGILFIWQIPHFLALAFMYKDDYKKGGFKMLATNDGELVARISVIASLCLIPLNLFLTQIGATGFTFAGISIGLGCWISWKSFQFWRERTIASARKLFFTTIIYLPLLLAAMLINRNFFQWTDYSALNV